MKKETIINIIIALFCFTAWTILSRFLGFETTVLIALATIYGMQK